jgi:hypothetical protein
MLVRTRVRLATKIRSKLSLCHHRHFTEHLVGAFGKSPRESDLNYKTSSFSIRQLKNNIGFILTSRSSGHRVPDMCSHSRSSASGLLLLPRSSLLPAMPHLPPAHHETSKCDSPNETEINVKLPKCPGFKFKLRQVNDSSQSNQGTDTWFLNLPLDESINNKKYKV